MTLPTLHDLASWVFLAQQKAAEAVPDAVEDDGADQGIFGGLGFMLPIAAIFMLYIFLFSKPNKKEKARQKEMLTNLKKNDRVTTIGGIVATVSNVQTDSDYVTLRIDDTTNTKMKIRRSAIASVITDEDAKSAADSK